MRILSFFLAGLIVLAMFFSCQPQKQETATSVSITLENRVVQQNKGADCEKQPDSLRTDCAIIDFTVPNIQGTGALSQNVTAWVDKFLIHLLVYSDYPELEPSKAQPTVEAAIKRFYAMQEESKGSMVGGQFKAMCTHGELLNDGKYLTLMLDGYSFQGGNHHLEEVDIATFDVKTGKQLAWADLVNDPESLVPIAQARVKTERADTFYEGFDFDKSEAFKLPNAYGLTANGLLMHYSPDEIYQLGGATEFTIPYSELGANLKITAPAVPTVEGDETTDVSDIFEAKGDSLVIPTFEVEVMKSPKAAADMKKRNETVIVSAMFYGEPLDPKEKAKGEDGQISVLNKDLELTGTGRIARFEGLKFHKNLLKKIEGGDINLLINVYSGRKSSEDNLLACGLVDAKASNFGDHRYLVACPLITESPDGYVPMTVPFALPDTGSKPTSELPIVVDCNERGEIFFAGATLKDMDGLKTVLREALLGLRKQGVKAVPEIKTAGCLMGMQGAIRDVYEELKIEKQENKATEKGTETTSVEKVKTTEKVASKTTVIKPAYPTITLNEKNEMALNGKKIATFEELRKQLQTTLLAYDIIPDDVPIKTVGTTGMGTRAEMKTEITDAIKGAKWLRKKAAIAVVAASVGKKLGTEVQLEVGNYQTSGNFSFLDARPKTIDGKAIDYSKMPIKAATDNLADRVLALLQYSNGTWKVLDFKIGANTAPVDSWVKNYKAPKGLFAKVK
ncbi:MAG: hypothetical protein GC192_03955 [Bacteroidetes bacterium]|nr:hypothetical protein [Bacteroidota bacterium]